MIARSQLAREIGVDRASLQRWEAAGYVPRAIRINPTFSGYTPAAALAVRAFAEARK